MSVRKGTRWLVIILVIVLNSSLSPHEGYAVPAAPLIHTLSQSDGTTFRARQWGDESLHGWETLDGYSIVFDSGLENWTYAVPGEPKRLISSQKSVGKDSPPEKIHKHLRPKGQTRSMSLPVFLQEGVPPTGTAHIPVILTTFSDTTPTFEEADFTTLLFGTDNHSLKDYFEEVSYGVFSISGSVVGWYKASKTHDYYGENDASGEDSWPGTLVREAVAKADGGGFNFTPYDRDGDCYVDVVAIVHQGTGQEAGGETTDIWSHRWDLDSAYYFGHSDGGAYTTGCPCSKGGTIKVNDYIIVPENLFDSITTIGVFAHEFGHSLGLPDLYDTDWGSRGIGYWSLMANGSWNYVFRYGDRPAHMDAWCKYKLGWVTPTQVSGTLMNEPINQAVEKGDVYQLLNGSPSTGGEYFLIENRQKAGFDQGLPGAGLLIWHIEETMQSFGNNRECYPGILTCPLLHYHVALEQADNLWELEMNMDNGDAGDPYPGTTNNRWFTESSSPNSNLYSGSLSNVSVTNISDGGATMTASLSIGGCSSWEDVIEKYKAYVDGQASWDAVIDCYNDYNDYAT